MENTIKVKIENFEGPLDLLIHLIEKKKMDINSINISQIIDDYLSYIHTQKGLNLKIKVEFLIMATDLIEIKAYSILNRDKKIEKIEEQKAKLLEKKDNAEDLYLKFMGEFSKELDKTTKESLRDVLKEVFEKADKRDKWGEFLIVGGDDVCAVFPPNLVMEISMKFQKRFEEQMAIAMKEITKDIGEDENTRITSSSGVIIAKAKTPMFQLFEQALHLQKSAKKARKKAVEIESYAEELSKQNSNRIIERSEKEAEYMLESARTQIEKERLDMENNMKTKILDLSLKLNSKIFNKESANKDFIEKEYDLLVK